MVGAAGYRFRLSRAQEIAAMGLRNLTRVMMAGNGSGALAKFGFHSDGARPFFSHLGLHGCELENKRTGMMGGRRNRGLDKNDNQCEEWLAHGSGRPTNTP